MFRHLILPTLVAVLLIPDWASAFFRRKAAVSPAAPTQKVQYYAPVYSPPPCPPMFAAPVACCPPVAVVKPTTPQVVPERMATPKPVAPETNPMAVTPKSEKLVEPKLPSVIPNQETKLPETPEKPVVPVTNIEVPKVPVATETVNLPPISVPATPPESVQPKPTLNPPPVKDVTNEDKKVLPAAPDSQKLPPLSFGQAPETTPEEPKVVAPMKPELPKGEFPNLDLPIPPQLAVPKEVEVKSSPIDKEKKSAAFEMFPVDGPVVGPDEKRIVTFYNFTGRDVQLTIDGKAYTLPAKHTVEGKLGSQFKMQIGVGEEHELKVPASASGVDVVLKK